MLFIFIFFIIFFYGSLGPYKNRHILRFENVPCYAVLPVGPPQCRMLGGCSPPTCYCYHSYVKYLYPSPVLALQQSLYLCPYQHPTPMIGCLVAYAMLLYVWSISMGRLVYENAERYVHNHTVCPVAMCCRMR